MDNYKIHLDIGGMYNLTFTEENISLGSIIKETMDKSYDVANITLPVLHATTVNNKNISIDTSKEFQPYTMVDIVVYIPDESGSAFTQEMHMHMIVESDAVQEVYIGDKTRYTHNLVLIEASKLLEGIIMPNITLTQPVTNSKKGTVVLDNTDVAKVTPTNATAQTMLEVGATAVAGAVVAGTVAVTVCTKIAAVAASGSWAAAHAGPLGWIIAGCLLIVALLASAIAGYANADAIAFVSFMKALNARIDEPTSKMSKNIRPGMSIGLPTATITISESGEGLGNTIQQFFGPGGVWGAVLIGVVTPITSIIKLFMRIGDQSIKLTLKPAYAVLTKTDDNNYAKLLGHPTLHKEVESSESWGGYTMTKYTYYQIDEDELFLPDDLDEGTYNITFFFNLENMWQRNYTWWPFYVEWTDMNLGQEFQLDSMSEPATIRSMLSASTQCYYTNLVYDKSTVTDSDDKNTDVNVYLDTFMHTLENQISIRELTTVSKQPVDMIADTMIDTSDRTKTKSTANETDTLAMLSPIRKITDDSINVQLSVSYYYKLPDGFKNKEMLESSIHYQIQFLGDDNTEVSYSDTFSNWRTTKINTNNTFTDNISYTIPKSATKYRYAVILYPVENTRVNVSQGTKITVKPDMTLFNTPKITEKRKFYSAPLYHFSQNALSQAHILCPEITFNKKTLWEVCLEIGQMLNAMPVLLSGNCIDYIPLDKGTMKDTPVSIGPSSSTKNMTNYASKLVTPDMKNLVLDNSRYEEAIAYPYPGGWIKVRAGSETDVAITRETAVISLGKNNRIYKIRRLYVKTQLKGETYSKVYNITNFVYEKTLWDALSNQIDVSFTGNNGYTSEKGCAIYYTKGDYKLMNVAQLPNNASILGWKQTSNTIQFILAKAYKIPLDNLSDDIFDYEFRVEYIPYHDRYNISKKADMSDTYTQIANNFNQTSNTISSTAFSKLCDNTLKSMGNSEITTSYISNDVDDGISVGDMLTISGKKYYVNNKMTTLNNYDKDVTLQLTRDNYKLDDRISIPKEYRQYNIDSSNVVRKTLIKPYTIIVSEDKLSVSDTSSYRKDYSSKSKQAIAASLVSSLDASIAHMNPISNVYITPLNKYGNRLEYSTVTTNQTAYAKRVILPVIGDVLGNTITLTWDAMDNYSMGMGIRTSRFSSLSDVYLSNMKTTTSVIDNSTGKNITVDEGKYGYKLQSDARYVDDYGRCPRLDMTFFSVNTNNKLSPSLASTLPITEILPQNIDYYIERSMPVSIMAEKDSREKLSGQINISIQTFDNNISIYDILKYNSLVSDINSKISWYGYTGDISRRISSYNPYVMDKMDIELSGPTEVHGDPMISLLIKNNTGNAYDGIVGVYESGEVALSVNKHISSSTSVPLYFYVYNSDMTLTDYDVSQSAIVAKDAYKDIVPTVKIIDNKFYITNTGDMEELIDKGMHFQLVTKHNTNGRGIAHTYRGGNYRKHKAGDSLYHISNCYTSNPSRSNPDYPKRYYQLCYCTKLDIKDDGELVYTNVRTNETHNFMDYLAEHKISYQDLGGRKKSTHAKLQYGIVGEINGIYTGYTTPFTAIYDTLTRKMSSISY